MGVEGRTLDPEETTPREISTITPREISLPEESSPEISPSEEKNQKFEAKLMNLDPEFLKISAEILHNQALDKAAKSKGSMYASKEDIPKRFQKYRMKSRADYAAYIRKCRESDGYDVSGCSGRLPGGIFECSTTSWVALFAAEFAINEYNWEKETHLKFMGLVRASVQGVAGTLYYLTLQANNCDGSIRNYRAKVWLHVSGRLSLEEFKKEPKKKHSTIKSPFNIFVDELRKSPKLASAKYKRVIKTASLEWRRMSDQDKEIYRKKCADSGPQDMGTQDNEVDKNEDPDSHPNIILYHT